MRFITTYATAAVLLLGSSTAKVAGSQTSTAKSSLIQPNLTAPGSIPFHLKATIFEQDDPDDKTTVEIYWISPDRWRRTIKSREFTQTRIVNGGKVFEQNDDDYIPVHLQTLVTAMTDPQPLLDSLRPGDRLETQANGAGVMPAFCANLQGPNAQRFAVLCGSGIYAGMETVGAPGREVRFSDYRKFHGKKVARLLLCTPAPHVTYRGIVTDLDELKKTDESLFAFAEATAAEKQIQVAELSETDLRSLAVDKVDVIWPQVLDGAVKGKASYYISIDRSGKVRETSVVQSDNERANDSARRQISNWKFRPAMRGSVAVQAEGILSFANLDTRKFGPSEPLSNEETRRLASNVMEPEIPAGKFPKGTTYTLRAAIDDAGNVIEVIAADGPPELFKPCYDAIRKWKFAPVMENGEPRPYRAEIRFQTP